MAFGDLIVEVDYIRPYSPYPGYNHHYTQLSFKAKFEGGADVYLNSSEIFLFSMQGNREGNYPPGYAFGSVSSGTCTSAAATPVTRFTDTSQAWGTDTLVGRFLLVTTGTGSNQCMRITSNTNDTLYMSGDTWSVVPTAGATYRIHEYSGFAGLRVSHQDLRPSRFFPHDEYTIWVMAYNDSGVAKVTRVYVNINEFLSNRPGVTNSKSPVVIARSQNLIGDNTVTVRAKQGDIVRVYNKIQMDDTALNVVYPEQANSMFVADGNYYHVTRTIGFRPNPIASANVIASNGEVTVTFQNDTAIYGSSNRKYVVSTETPGLGESFATAHWKLGLGGTADECRQIRTIWTPSLQTSVDSAVTGKPNGVLCRYYTIECKQISQVNGTESTPTQSDFYYNNSNNGDAYNISIATGVWFEMGKNTTILIVDINSNGTDNAYWSENVEVPGQTASAFTSYSSLADAVTRGPNTLLAKETTNFYATSVELGGVIYTSGNSNASDLTKIPDGFYFKPDVSLAIQTSNGEIIGKQQVGGSPVY